ncbi:MAG: aconitate hydratase [Euryarchaeota archaeon]|nr:aconitate hydratase [Euryarchaeota archaeon]
MTGTLTERLIQDHTEGASPDPGEEVALSIDQTLTQDATGTLVMLELEAMGLDRVKTDVSAQYIDHNIIQADHRNPDDHLYLRSACRRFGVHYSRPGNGVSHPVHMETFGMPGKTLLGSDSHTVAAGSLGMLAIGAGGLQVAMAMAGEPYHVQMPEVWRVELKGRLKRGVSAKDIILEMLRRHGVDGCAGAVLEYTGEGLEHLSAMDRHTIANMGQETGATTSVFPSDEETRRFLARRGRGDDWRPLAPDDDATYDHSEEIDLGRLEPLIAKPSSPGNVVPVAEVAGGDIYQAYVGSSANPGFRDFAVAAAIVDGYQVDEGVSFDVNPTSRSLLDNLATTGHLTTLLRAGARIHQTGCNGCIGMGQAPATGRRSLRTVPRNFPGRSGTKEDAVYLCSPETAAASALTGVITDPRELDWKDGGFSEPEPWRFDAGMVERPPKPGTKVEFEKGPNIQGLPDFETLPDAIKGPVLLKTGDDVSTDEILPGGTKVLPYRSNIPAISRFTFYQVDEGFHDRAKKNDGPFFIVAGSNYGQGSSREHAAIAPRYLGLAAVVAKGFARIHQQNLTNFGVVPLTFVDTDDHGRIDQGDWLVLPDLRKSLESARDRIPLKNETKDETYETTYKLSDRALKTLIEGGAVLKLRKALAQQRSA